MVWDFREASGLLKPASPPCSSCTVRSVVSPFTSSAWRRASGRWRTSWRTGAAVAASSAMCVGDSTRPPRYPQSTGRKHTGETPLQSPPCSFLRFRSGASRRKQSARARASLRSAPMPSPLFLQQLLECNKCRNSYHPECLGPNYPTKPTKKKKVWVRHCDLFSVIHLTDGNATGQSAAGGGSDAVTQPDSKAGCLLRWKVHLEIDNEVGP